MRNARLEKLTADLSAQKRALFTQLNEYSKTTDRAYRKLWDPLEEQLLTEDEIAEFLGYHIQCYQNSVEAIEELTFWMRRAGDQLEKTAEIIESRRRQ